MKPTVDIDRLTKKAVQNVHDIVTIALEHTPEHRTLVVYDTKDPLAQILTNAYRVAVPSATFVDFDMHSREEIIARFDELSPRDLVVLIQSSDFRLNEFRIRIYLFQKKLKVIDHLHLYRNAPDSWETYIDALEYDSNWYRVVGKKLKATLDKTQKLVVRCGDAELVATGGLESAKLNVGDYTGMENIGGTFPIGEVFTEAKNLENVNGSLLIYAFAGADFHIEMHKPFRIDIAHGLVVGWDDTAPQAFVDIVAQVRSNERSIIREIGFGLNRAITKDRYVKDITAFERILGLHFSLGEKHTVYKKQGITPDKTRYHVDLFPAVTEVFADDICIFKNDSYVVESLT